MRITIRPTGSTVTMGSHEEAPFWLEKEPMGPHYVGADPYYINWEAFQHGIPPEIRRAGNNLITGPACYCLGYPQEETHIENHQTYCPRHTPKETVVYFEIDISRPNKESWREALRAVSQLADGKPVDHDLNKLPQDRDILKQIASSIGLLHSYRRYRETDIFISVLRFLSDEEDIKWTTQRVQTLAGSMLLA